METRVPTPARITVAALFALSCFGLILFLWLAFGGPVPLKPKGYQVDVLFPSAPLVAVQADVRVSGVPIGKVEKIVRDGRYSRATLQIRERYAPLHRDVRAIIRRKTLLGEGYVELSPGSRAAPLVPEGGTIPASHVRAPVALDEILSAFDPRTRTALRSWLQGWARGVQGRSVELSDAAAHFGPALENTGGLLDELSRQRRAVSTLVRDTGRSFAAIGARESRVADLIRNSRSLFATTAQSDRGLHDTIRALPAFLAALDAASAATRRAAVPVTPLLAQLRPAARALPATLAATQRVAPQLRAIARPLDRAVAVAPSGLAAASEIVRAAGPLVGELYPLGRRLVPMLDLASAYRREFTSFAKGAAATQSKAIVPGSNRMVHYLRAPAVFPIEPNTTSRHREPYNRGNAYMAPGGLDKFLTGPLEAFDCRNVDNPQGNPPIGTAPPCVEQKPWAFEGVTASYPRLREAP